MSKYTALLIFYVALLSCRSITKETFTSKEVKEELRDSVRSVYNDSLEKTVFKGLKDHFVIQSDSLGRVAVFHKAIDNGLVSGFFYCDENECGYEIESEDLESTDRSSGSNHFQKTNEVKETNIDSESIKTKRKWGTIEWIMFILSLLATLYLVFRVYNVFRP